jgi:hypothetical protein
MVDHLAWGLVEGRIQLEWRGLMGGHIRPSDLST